MIILYGDINFCTEIRIADNDSRDECIFNKLTESETSKKID